MNNEDFWDGTSDQEYMTEEEAEMLENEEYEYEEEPETEEFMELYEDEYEDLEEEDLEEKTANVLDDALIRLEQGKLYKMILEHIESGMFEDVGCDQRSVSNVEKEMKAFIMSRLEVLLGIRKKKSERAPKPAVKKIIQKVVEKESDFDEVEKAILKKAAETMIQKSGIKKISSNESTIKKVAQPQPQQKSQPAKKHQPKPVQEVKPKAQPQTKKTTKKKVSKKKASKMPSKSPYKMSAEELIQRNKQIKATSSARPVANAAAIPVPTSDQLEQHYAMQEQMAGGSNNPMDTIMKIVAAQKARGE